MAKGDKYFRGRGKIWLDTVNYADCYKSKMERKDDYEEVDDPSGKGSVQVFMGYKIDGSVTLRKTGNMEILKKLKANKKAFEFDMIIKEENPDTGDFETIKYLDCTIESFPLSDFENKKITEVELAVKARDYKVLA